MVCIDPHRQIEKDAENIEEYGFLKKFIKSGQGSDGRVQKTSSYEVSGHHQKEGHGDPGKDSGKEKITPLADNSEGRGMNCNYK